MNKKIGLSLFAVFFLFATLSMASASLTDGLIAYLKLNESSGDVRFNAVSGEANFIVGGSPSVISGIRDNALDFEGVSGNYLENTSIYLAGLAGTSASSVCMWVNITAGGDYSTIYTWHSVEGATNMVIQSDAGNNFYADSYFSDSQHLANSSLDWTPFLNQWTFVCHVVNSSYNFVYINGQEYGFGATGSYDGGAEITFGNDRDGLRSRTLKGSMDEISIYNRSILSTEVFELYGNGTPPDLFAQPVFVGFINTTLIFPPNQTNTTTISVQFNATITPTNVSLTNATLFIWYENSTLFAKQNISLNGTIPVQALFTQNMSLGSFKYNVFGCGITIGNSSDIQCNFANNNYTLNINPVIVGDIQASLYLPPNQTDTTEINILFNATINPLNVSLTNATLFIWYSNATLFAKNTSIISGTSATSVLFYQTMELGTFEYNILGCGENIANSSDIQCNFAESNFTLIISALPIEEEQRDNIYYVLSSSGAGLGKFMQYMTQTLPLFLLGLMLVGLVILLANVLKTAFGKTWYKVEFRD